MTTINTRPSVLFADAEGSGPAERSLTFDECTVVHAAVENLSQRQTQGGGTVFSVGSLLSWLQQMNELPNPDRYIGPVVEYLQRLVGVGLLVDENNVVITEFSGVKGRRYRAPAWDRYIENIHSSPARALGLPYVAHTFGAIVVRVHCGKGDDAALGSGVVIANDLCVTNAHVVESGRDVFVSYGDGAAVPAIDVRIAKDPNLDLALVEAPGLVPVPMAWMRAPKPAESIVALGYPMVPQVETRPLLRFPGSVASDGSVDTYYGLGQAIVTAVFTPGASGGGVFSSDGRLVGLVVRSLESDILTNDGRREYTIFHAMIPGDVVLRELKRMHKKCWFLNEFGNEESMRERERQGATEEYTRP